MGQLLLILAVALVVGVIVFGVAVLITGSDSGLEPAEPDGKALPLPTHRPLGEADLARVRFDLVLRGYRMSQVDQALRRAAYDIGYKDELISVLEAEVNALRSGRTEDAEAMRRAREAALAGTTDETQPPTADTPSVVDLGLATASGGPVPVSVPRSGPVADLVPGTPPPTDAVEVAPAAVDDEAADEVADEAERETGDETGDRAEDRQAAEDVVDSDEPAAAPPTVPAAEAEEDPVGDPVPGSRR